MAKKDGWVKLSPPEAGTVRTHMVRSNPWNCDLLPAGDPRASACGKSVDVDDLFTGVSCGETSPCSVEYANSFRTNFVIGALPCCPTGRFCAAPACNLSHRIEKSLVSGCTERSAAESFEYLQQKSTWPAFHGHRGSFELDTLKYIDLLGCRPSSTTGCTEPAFDVVFDIGANTGYFTEQLTVRHFARNYILVEANDVTAKVLNDRWTSNSWKRKWFLEQVPVMQYNFTPNFEIHTAALSNTNGEYLNACLTQSYMQNSSNECEVKTKTLDELVQNDISPEFREMLSAAHSAFIKIDTEGMDELVLQGMSHLLSETRGKYHNGDPHFLVNFIQYQVAPAQVEIAREREDISEYSIQTVTEYLEKHGFESFLIGPRFLPLSALASNSDFLSFIADPQNNAGVRTNFPEFDGSICPLCAAQESASFAANVLAIRSTHPYSAKMKLALGACRESTDFYMTDPQYSF